MTAEPKGPGAPSPAPDRQEHYLRPRWRRADRVLLVCFAPAGLAMFLGSFISVPAEWFYAPFFAVASAHAAVQVLGQRFAGPRRAMEVGLGASLMALLLTLSLSLAPHTGAAVALVLAEGACFCVWGLAAVVALLLTMRAMQAEGRERQRAEEGAAAPEDDGRHGERSRRVRRGMLVATLGSVAWCGVLAWFFARQGLSVVPFVVGAALMLLWGLFAIWWSGRSRKGRRPGR